MFAVIDWILGIAWYILLAAGLWKTFEKAHEAGWKALIPIYNFYILFKISWKTDMFWFWVGISLIASLLLAFTTGFMYILGYVLTMVQAIMIAVLWYNVSLSFGHGLGWFLGLYFLNPIFIIMLGFGSSRYAGNRYSLHGMAM